MKRALNFLFLFGGIVCLTILMFLGLTRIDPLLEWLHSNAGYSILAPLFRAYGADGVEGHEEVIGAVLIVVSFLIACSLTWVASRLIRRNARSA